MYKFKTKPFKHQAKVFKQSWDRKSFALFMEMGTGKTKIAIDTIGSLYLYGKINMAFVVAPKGVYDNWVFNEIPIHLPDTIKHKILRWQPNITQTYKKEFVEFMKATGLLKLFVMNIEAFSTSKGAETASWILKKHPKSIMIVDESTTIKNRKARPLLNRLWICFLRPIFYPNRCWALIVIMRFREDTQLLSAERWVIVPFKK